MLKSVINMFKNDDSLIPTKFIDKLEDVKKYGIEIATKMSTDLLNFGAPGIHFYTMNSADSTMAIAKNIGALNEH